MFKGRQKDPDGALEVWSRLKTENYIPSYDLRYLFEKILTDNGRQIPFDPVQVYWDVF